MNNLIAANFIRIKKSKLLWAGMALMALLAAVMSFTQYREAAAYGVETSLDKVFFVYAVPISILTAVFSSIFLGAEYSDGVIRNKIIIGHGRMEIYFASFFSLFTAAMLYCLAFLAGAAVVGIPLIGGLTTDSRTVLLVLLGTFLLVVAYCSIFTMISMVCSNKTSAAVVSLLFIIGMFLFSLYIDRMLEAPPFLPQYTMDGGEPESVPNPKYVTGTLRACYTFLSEFLPASQSSRYATLTAVHLWQMPLYSLGIILGTTAVGTAVFRRKDLK